MDKNKTWIELPNIDKDCFGCGAENPHGLQMKFVTNGEKVKSSVTIPAHLRGWHHIVHGGVISTIADEIMAWAAIHLLKRFILTKTMTTKFFKPVFIGSKLIAYGSIKERTDDRNVIMACEIYDETKNLVAGAEGEFALFTADQFKNFNLVPEKLLEDMNDLFS